MPPSPPWPPRVPPIGTIIASFLKDVHGRIGDKVGEMNDRVGEMNDIVGEMNDKVGQSLRATNWTLVSGWDSGGDGERSSGETALPEWAQDKLETAQDKLQTAQDKLQTVQLPALPELPELPELPALPALPALPVPTAEWVDVEHWGLVVAATALIAALLALLALCCRCVLVQIGRLLAQIGALGRRLRGVRTPSTRYTPSVPSPTRSPQAKPKPPPTPKETSKQTPKQTPSPPPKSNELSARSAPPQPLRTPILALPPPLPSATRAPPPPSQPLLELTDSEREAQRLAMLQGMNASEEGHRQARREAGWRVNIFRRAKRERQALLDEDADVEEGTGHAPIKDPLPDCFSPLCEDQFFLPMTVSSRGWVIPITPAAGPSAEQAGAQAGATDGTTCDSDTITHAVTDRTGEQHAHKRVMPPAAKGTSTQRVRKGKMEGMMAARVYRHNVYNMAFGQGFRALGQQLTAESPTETSPSCAQSGWRRAVLSMRRPQSPSPTRADSKQGQGPGLAPGALL